MAVETKEKETKEKDNPKFEKVAGELESWSILEIAKFGKFLQDRWGVSAAPVAVAAAPGAGGAGGAAAEAEEKTEFTVVLKEAGGQRPAFAKSNATAWATSGSPCLRPPVQP